MWGEKWRAAGMMSAIVEYNVGKNVMVPMGMKRQGTITEAKQSEGQIRHLGLHCDSAECDERGKRLWAG